ncbi:glycerophosphodiester phosphodiesterase [Pseudomonas citronellolis]|uniref:glycerophosphodiester phosphodiesterase n=1 Tax=Pseudomonas citronellolis TaxID=53408 RepID=UPI002647D58F|nr:glycerophosphodiester phosphodiesterase [Pseudomonas citronellolis]MDN6874638.1 glycerophosphodiester phosphodiesterase [Pseudomonas citronellolis]
MADNETIPEREEAMVSQGEALVGLLHQFIHGDSDQTVPTDSGPLNTLRKMFDDILLEALGSYTSTYSSVEQGLAATPDGGFFGVISAEEGEDRVLYWKSGGVAVDTGKRSVSAAGVAELRDRFRDGRRTAYYKVGDGSGYNRWLAYDDGGYGTAEASVGPQGIELSEFSLTADQAGELVFKDAHGFYAQRLQFAKPLLDLDDGCAFAIKDVAGYYCVSATAQGFASKAPAAASSTPSSEALDNLGYRIDDILGRSELRGLQLISHRGFSSAATENTLLAFSNAVRRGASVIEIDVLFSSDGVPYISHDATADRLMTQGGVLREMTAAQIDALVFKEWDGTPFANAVRIPRFSDYLQFAAENGVHTIVEIKESPNAAALELVVQMVADMGLELLCTFASFNASELATIRRLSPHTRLSLVNDNATAWQSRIDQCAMLRADYSQEGGVLLTIPQAVAYARAKGVGITCWTIDNLAQARQLQRLGVNRIYSNYVLEARR